MRHGFPIATPGQRIGLLGGSFDPPHEGHRHITRWALRAFGLDRVWWLVSPGNPLKARGPRPLAERMVRARAIVSHPRVVVTDLEARLGSRYTADTLEKLMPLYPGVRFVWLMGADNLAGFHHWDRWQTIIERVPMGVLARPGVQLRAGLSPAALTYRRFRLPAHAARLLATCEPPCWTLLTGPMSSESSTEIRNSGRWP